MAYDEGLAERIRDVLRDRAGVSEKKLLVSTLPPK